jgi:cytochrome P450
MHYGVRDLMKIGDAVDGAKPVWSLSRDFWETMKEKRELSDEEAAYTLGAFVEASMASTPSTLKIFFLAMLHHLQWQIKLQKEVDEVWDSSNGFACWAEREKFPTARAILKEIIRWRPALPGGSFAFRSGLIKLLTTAGLPHTLSADDVCNGCTLKKGILAPWHHWTVSRDPKLFPDPENFNLGRYLEPPYPSVRAPLSKYPTLQFDPRFGLGRRVCPGVQLAKDMMLAAVVAIARHFTMKKRKDSNGKEVEVPWYECVDGLPSKLAAFEIDLVPR